MPSPSRLVLVVHPTRDVGDALDTLRSWAAAHEVEVVQAPVEGDGGRRLADSATIDAADLVVAVGGDGTVLSALRASAPTGSPVLGVACGSLGALTAVPAGELAAALERYASGAWTARSLPALRVSAEGAVVDWSANDFVAARRGSGQLATEVAVDGELYARMAGDGVIVATAVGSSAYSMAAGGPVLAGGTDAFVCTPLAMHGGSAPPLVVPGDAVVTIVVVPGHAGCDIEIDGHRRPHEARAFDLALHRDRLRLVAFAEEAGHGLAALRRRRLITDSPRILARDDRIAAARERPAGR